MKANVPQTEEGPLIREPAEFPTVAYLFFAQGPGGRTGLVRDNITGMVVSTQLRRAATAFQSAMAQRGVAVTFQAFQAADIVDRLQGVPERFGVIEAMDTDPEDAIKLARELAARLPVKPKGDVE